MDWTQVYEIIQLTQGSQEWLAHRKKYVNASELPIIMGKSQYGTPYSLWSQKMGLSPETQENINMKFGKDSEAEIRDYLNQKHRYSLKPVVAVSTIYDFLSASLDGWDPCEMLICEIKCNNQINHSAVMRGKVPDLHFPQIQAQMAVMGTQAMLYVSKWMDDIQEIIVHRDDEYIKGLIMYAESFYNCLINFQAPSLTDRDYVHRTDPEWSDLAQGLKEAQAKREWWEKEEKDIKDKLIKMASGQPSIGSGIKLQKVVRRGTIQYDKIDVLKDLDLERYRSKHSESWRITKVDES